MKYKTTELLIGLIIVIFVFWKSWISDWIILLMAILIIMLSIKKEKPKLPKSNKKKH